MGSLHVPRLAWPRWARPRRGRRRCAALAIAVLAALPLVNGAQHAAYGATEGPYGGTAAAVPGTVQAANYDTGGQGVAYNVTSANGSANSYRSDGVDLETTADTQDTSAAGGAYDMGWTTPGQWFKYTVHVATAGSLHGQLPGVLAVRDHRRAAHRQLLRHQPDRRGRRPEHRRVRDLDHGHRQRHPAGRRADAHRRPGLQRLELPLLGLHPGIGRRRRRRRHRPDRVLRHAGPRAGPADHGLLDPGRHRLPGARRHRRRPRHPLVQRGPATRSGWRSTSAPSSRSAAWASSGRPRTPRRSSSRCPTTTRPGPTIYSTTTGTGGNHDVPRLRDRPLHPHVRHGAGAPSSATRSSSSTSTA